MANATYRFRGKNSTGAALNLDLLLSDATSDADAKTMGQSIATLLGTPVTVFKSDGTLINSYTPGSQGTTVSSVTCSVVSAI